MYPPQRKDKLQMNKSEILASCADSPARQRDDSLGRSKLTPLDTVELTGLPRNKQPMYTKKSPKLRVENPITGLRSEDTPKKTQMKSSPFAMI